MTRTGGSLHCSDPKCRGRLVIEAVTARVVSPWGNACSRDSAREGNPMRRSDRSALTMTGGSLFVAFVSLGWPQADSALPVATVIDPSQVQGPVGVAPPAVDPDA